LCHPKTFSSHPVPLSQRRIFPLEFVHNWNKAPPKIPKSKHNGHIIDYMDYNAMNQSSNLFQHTKRIALKKKYKTATSLSLVQLSKSRFILLLNLMYADEEIESNMPATNWSS
jgi:hypothetical protein